MSAQTTAGRPSWANLPTLLWEQIAAALRTRDVMALRQAWRGAAHLADDAVRATLVAKVGDEFSLLVATVHGAAVHSAADDVAATLSHVKAWFAERASQPRRAVRLLAQQPLPDGSGLRCTFELQPRGAGAGVAMQAVLCVSEPEEGWFHPEWGDHPTCKVEVEQLRFLAPGGALLAEYGIAWSLNEGCPSVHSLRLATAGFGRLQAHPLSEAAAHFEAPAAAAATQPLRAADGRWSDGLLLPEIHGAVTRMFPPLLS